MGYYRRLISISCACCLAVSLFSYVAAEDAQPQGASDQQFVGFNLEGYGDKGQKSWEVKGTSADVFPNSIELKGVDAKLYGQEDVVLTAKEGTFDKTNNAFHLQDDVVATTATGSKVTTDSLNWSQSDNTITTDDAITVERENIRATSQGAVAQPDLNRARMLKDVSVEIQSQDGTKGLKKTLITCDGPLEIDYEKQIAVFNNNVKVNDENGVIESDVIQVSFDGQTKKINTITAIGHVKIVRGENISYSDEAVYNAETKRVVLSGRPQLILFSEKGLDDVSLGN